MRLNIYSVFDAAVGVYKRPFFAQADGEAIRAFGDIAADTDHEIGKHPEDYSLFRIGTWDDGNAKLHPEDRECLVHALETLKKDAKK